MVVVIMKTETKEEKVVVRFEGPTSWDIDFAGRGHVALRPGGEIGLNPRDVLELRALLAIMKEVNRPRTNRRIRLKQATPDGYKEQEFVPKFMVVKGLESLPEVLQKHSYSENNMYSDGEKEAILELCPKFFEQMTIKQRQR